jgi:hypothetical protein
LFIKRLVLSVWLDRPAPPSHSMVSSTPTLLAGLGLRLEYDGEAFLAVGADALCWLN